MTLIVVIGIFFSCRNKIEEIKAITDQHNYPIQTTTNGEYLFTEHGVLKNKLVASKLERYEEGDSSKTVVSGGFVLYVYDTLGQTTATMSADNGIYYTSLNRLEAKDNVKLINEKQQILETKTLVWLQDSDKVYTQDTVKITTLEGVIFGQQGMTSNADFSNYRVFDPVGEIYVNNKTE